ncbi:uncharacterized protein [Acropora muricata]|uniref:uncharacterized protein n=1 Tax=Acropora muricata TaxID=159855 RepID=UPI0034E5679B
MQGLASSTRRVYLSAQRRYISFCHQDGHVDANGALLPADERSLMRFATSLSDSLRHSSIKLYLIAACSLHIDQGLPYALVNCLQLQCLLRGKKGVQGSSPTKRIPINIDILRVIQGSLDLKLRVHVMLWAACCFGFFAFLRADEFTTSQPFDPSIHPTVSDLQVDTLVNPTCFQIRIKCSKTDLFRIGCDIYVDRGRGSIFPVAAIGNFLACVVLLQGLCSAMLMVALYQCSLSYTRQVILAPILATAFALAQPQKLHQCDRSLITLSKLYVGGQVMPIPII